MERYTILCTKEQTRKALELGAPIRFKTLCHYDLQGGKFIPYADLDIDINGDPILIPPTAEQMLGWLEEQNLTFKLYEKFTHSWHYFVGDKKYGEIKDFDNVASRKEATIDAIDAALDYLMKKEK